MSNRLENKVALVTGAGSGIGAAICQCFAEEGATVIATDINLEAVQSVVTSINATHGNAYALQQDVVSESRWREVISEIISQHGQLDILVNNAGIVIPASVEDCSLEDWKKTQAVNSESVFLGTQAAISVMKNSGGSIINISSIEGIVGEQKAAAYNASKGGVRIFSKSAALHCAGEGYPIRVNSVHPGYIHTPLVEKAMQDLGPEEAQKFMERVTSGIPVARLGQPRDVALGCVYLASNESSYVTGSELVIDGGYTAH